MSTTLAPLLVLVIVLCVDVWVYQDAKRCAGEGSPVVARIGTFAIDTPALWFAACLVLWIDFFPIYLVSRGTN